MARFPRTEPEVIALAQAMVSGLTANAVLYPAPPVLPAALTTLVSAYTTAKNAAIAAGMARSASPSSFYHEACPACPAKPCCLGRSGEQRRRVTKALSFIFVIN
jgi:hypothetical protein